MIMTYLTMCIATTQASSSGKIRKYPNITMSSDFIKELFRKLFRELLRHTPEPHRNSSGTALKLLRYCSTTAP